MNINKKMLKKGIWYEDIDGNFIPNDEPGAVPTNAHTRHVCFPLEITEKIYGRYNNKETCRHKLKYRRKTGGWIKGIKGCKCEACGKEKVGKSYIPFMFMPWQHGSDTYKMFSGSTNIGGGNEDVILAMANSGDYTLSEALVIFASACERCMNVLTYKYLNGKGGYKEMSEEWKKCGTVCDFCRDMGYTNRG